VDETCRWRNTASPLYVILRALFKDNIKSTHKNFKDTVKKLREEFA